MADSIDLLRLKAKAKLKLRNEQPVDDSTLIEQLRPVIKKMESGGRYDILHPKTKSGKQALGAYGVVPEFWFDQFPELGLKSSDQASKDKYLATPELQDQMFTKIAQKGVQATGGDPVKFRAWYYGGPKAVKNLENGTGNDAQAAYSDTGEKIAMPSHAADSQKFSSLFTGDEIDPAAEQELNSMILGNSRYKNKDPNDPANRLFNNPANQEEAVLNARKDAIKALPLSEQMGSGMGAFAYKFPGMGKVSELAGLAPKGSAKNKKETIEDYEQTRTGGQLAGELLPDAIIGAMGGEAATALTRANKIGQLGFKGAKALQYGTQGAFQGGVSAAMHAAQAKGSGKEVSGEQAALETGLSAFAGVLGGKLGDGLRALAPRVRQVSVGAPAKDAFGKNPINYASKEVEGVDRVTLARTLKAADERLKTLKVAKEDALLANSVEPVPPPSPQAPVTSKPAPIQPPPMPQAPIASVVPVRPNSTNTPGFFPISPEQQLAKRTAMIEADKARRMAEAATRRNAQVSPAATEQQKAMAAVNGPSKEANLSSLAEKQAALKPPKVEPKVDKGFTKADKKLVDEATEAEKSLALQKKLKGQRGSIDMSWMSGKKPIPEGIKLAEKPPKGLVEYTSPKGDKSFMTPEAAKKATETDRWLPTKNMRMAQGEVPKGIKLAEKPPKGLVQYTDPGTGESFFVNPEVAKKLNSQRGSLDLFPNKKATTTDEAYKLGLESKGKNPHPKGTDLADAWDEGKIDQAKSMGGDRVRANGPNALKGQRGAVINPFAKKQPPTPKPVVPTQELRKIHANDAVDEVQMKMDKSATTPGARNREPEYYSDYNSELAKWKDAIQKHPTVKGSKTGQMTVQDAHGLMQALDKTINYTAKNPGDRVVSDAAKDAASAVRKALRQQIKTHAPDVSDAMDKEAELIPYRNAVAKKVEEGKRTDLIPYVAKGGAAAIGAGAGALANPENRWQGATYGSLVGGGIGTTLSTMAGAKLLKTLGKAAVTDMTKTSAGRKTLSQLARAGAVKSKDKK